MKRQITLTICSLLASWSATAEPVQPSQTDALPASQPYAVYAQLGASPHAAHSQTIGVLLPWQGFQRQ